VKRIISAFKDWFSDDLTSFEGIDFEIGREPGLPAQANNKIINPKEMSRSGMDLSD